MEDIAEAIRGGRFQNIPNDVLYIIVGEYLTWRDIIHLCQTSQFFRQKICSHKLADSNPQVRNLWKQLYQRHISSIEPTGNPLDEYRYAIGFYDPLNVDASLELIGSRGYERLLDDLLQEQKDKGKLNQSMLRRIFSKSHEPGVIEILVKHGYRSRCVGQTMRGPCTRQCRPGDIYCWQHARH